MSETIIRRQAADAVAAEVRALGCDRSARVGPGGGGPGFSPPLTPAERDDVISVLPAGYGQSRALTSLSRDRSRAFLLLDLASIVTSHRIFHSHTSGPGVYSRGKTADEMGRIADQKGGGKGKGAVYISPQFRVTRNGNPVLLRLLVRLGVGLRCGTADDVDAVRAALRIERGGMGAAEAAGMDKGHRHHHRGGATAVVEGGEEGSSPLLPRHLSDPILVDDAGRVRKPDGYFRRLLFPNPDVNGDDEPLASALASETTAEQPMHIAVDGPDEVGRICRTLERVRRRRQRRGGKEVRQRRGGDDGDRNGGAEKEEDNVAVGVGVSIAFILRIRTLPPDDFPPVATAADLSDWDGFVAGTYAEARRLGSDLVGFSVDLSPWSRSLLLCDGDVGGDGPRRALSAVCASLRRGRILLHRLGRREEGVVMGAGGRGTPMRVDLTGMPYPLSRDAAEALSSALAGKVSTPISTEEMRSAIASSGPGGATAALRENGGGGGVEIGCRVLYTADVSDQLVARAGALCTRVIGAKRGTGTGTGPAMHYYIDDGCYGSLGSPADGEGTDPPPEEDGGGSGGEAPRSEDPIPRSGKAFHPLPLYGDGRSPPAIFEAAVEDSPPPPSSLALSPATVWGPTCDGLDRVCRSVPLPPDLRPENGDWLVFPRMGCGGFGGGLGLGTAFNGFDPPDTVYCLLGYFSGR